MLTRPSLALCTILAVVPAIAQAEGPMIRRLNPDTLPPPVGQSQVVVTESKKTIYVSGQTPLDAKGNLVGAGDFALQLEQVLRNLTAALSAAGVGASNIVKMTAYIVEFDPAVHGKALSAMTNPAAEYPATTLISVAGLARPNFLVEIDAIAVAD